MSAPYSEAVCVECGNDEAAAGQQLCTECLEVDPVDHVDRYERIYGEGSPLSASMFGFDSEEY